MARIFLTPGETAEVGRTQNTVFGTNDLETVSLAADSKTIFDASFNRGGDIINIAGNAGIYDAHVEGSTLVLTATNGAVIEIPIGTVGATINFANAERVLYYDAALNKICLGEQTLPASGAVVDVTPGSGEGTGPTPGGNVGITKNLTVQQDDFTGDNGGTANDDTFRARVVQNFLGEQTNTLGTGDLIDGKGGDDYLLATVQDASPLNGGPNSSIMPETVDVETAHFIALTTYNIDSGASNYNFIEEDTLGVEINAKQMLGLDEVGSLQSDASLTIYNLTTLTDSGLYEDRRATKSVTICMDHTGNGLAVTPESDLEVYFDQDYLLAEDNIRSGSTMTIEIMDMDAALTGQPPLLDNPFGQIVFTMDGVEKTLTFGTTANTYAELLADVQAAIANAAQTDPAFAQLTATLVVNGFTAQDTDQDPVIVGNPNRTATGDTIVITNSGPEALEAVTMRAIGDAPAGKDFHTNFEAFQPSEEGFKVTATICLEKVGRGSDGGELIVGSMATDHMNVWSEETKHEGIGRFEITVSGDSTQPSSLKALKSTNNTLCQVIVVSEAGSEADLTIGNSETEWEYEGVMENYRYWYGEEDIDVDLTSFKNDALKDVLEFDATGFVNDATVYAVFTSESVAKYMDLTDTSGNPADDNADAVYSFGGGDDLLNVNLNQENMAVIGTATREDFSFTANMGGGDDHVQIQIGDGFSAMYAGQAVYHGNYGMVQGVYDTGVFGLQTADNWYYNHVLNNNLRINTGDGDDVVETWGSTAAKISTGDGHDVIYTDNSGETGDENEGHATWVYNSIDDKNGSTWSDINDLQSQTSVTLNNVANLRLRVDYQGITRVVDVYGTVNGVSTNSVGAVNGVTITDLSINQAIKAAIDEDPTGVLSALLAAEDGPARTLLVRALIDGEHTEGDLQISLVSSGPLSVPQTNGAKALLPTDASLTAKFTELGFTWGVSTATAIDAVDERYNPQFAYGPDGTYNGLLDGYDSVNINNNTVEGGRGSDVTVLSSNGVGIGIGVYSSTEGNSTETIYLDDYSNGGFGDDVVINFTAAGDGHIRHAGPHDPDMATAARGYDIFDVSAIINGAVSQVDNDTTDDAEAATIGGVFVNNSVVIIDTVEANDLGFADTATINSELTRLQNYAKNVIDTTASANPTDEIWITVNDTTNVGTFYYVQNGVAANDATVTRIGSIQLGHYDQLGDTAQGKELIGDWDSITLTNFEVLTNDQMTITFDQIG